MEATGTQHIAANPEKPIPLCPAGTVVEQAEGWVHLGARTLPETPRTQDGRPRAAK